MSQAPNEADPNAPMLPESGVVPVEDPDAETDAAEENGESLRHSVICYGADLEVEHLVRRFESGEIVIPSFQRKFVWSRNRASRFVESLLLDLPVPEIFLFRELDTKKLLVVDGQQRIVTLSSFYGGRFQDSRFTLSGVSAPFQGKSYDYLDEVDRRALDDALIRATIFHQVDPADGHGAVYSIFERLNTGGIPSDPQEIRSCVYRGPLIDLLGELARDEDWRSLWGRSDDRKKDEEVILRFLALHNDLDGCRLSLKGFLNDFAARHRQWNANDGPAFDRQFRDSVRVVAASLGPHAFRPAGAINTAVAVAVLCGVAHRLDRGGAPDAAAWAPAWEELRAGLKSSDLVSGSTADPDRVRKRILLARKVFARV